MDKHLIEFLKKVLKYALDLLTGEDMNETQYKQLLGLMESSNNYKAENPAGALGKYQFIPSTLNYLQGKYNLPAWDRETFLNSPGMQEQYETYYIKDCQQTIKQAGLNKYFGRSVTGSMRFPNITANLSEAGMLAGMHLAGQGSIQRFFSTGYNPNDGYTSLTDYMAYFSNKLPGGISIDPGLLAMVAAAAVVGVFILYY